ncbi:MAG: 16S rRNA (guanine(966)-N(2))-methyltransferase RsmD [Bacilli bacterium]|nr:16S rRNA (guanine(966)-N(2))-methyltransferase RsmD [Bacilli bacterium]
MRIISGKLKGRKIKGYNLEGTRPTADRVKESIFSIISSYLDNSVCLDLFAGSGSLGLEALSRGAKLVCFVDNNKKVIKTLTENVQALDISNECIIYHNEYISALKYFNKNNIKFDLIFLDPPYNLDIINKILNYINDYNLLNINGLVICERNNNNFKDYYGNLTLIKNKKVGIANVYIYQNVIE